MTETKSKLSWFQVSLAILLSWFVWVWLSQIGNLTEVFHVQRHELCNTIAEPLCSSMYVTIFSFLGEPENWLIQTSTRDFFEELSKDFSIFLPVSKAIPGFFDRLYLASLIVIGHLGQILICVLIALPISEIAFAMGATKVKIKRLKFRGELPSIMQKEWLFLKCLLIATLCVSCCLIHVHMDFLMLALGALAFFIGNFRGIVHASNQP